VPDEVKHVLVLEVGAVRVEHVQPLVRHARHLCVTLRKRFSLQKRLEHLALEDLDELQLTATLDLEALELCERAVFVKHRVPLLDVLAFVLRCRQHHRAIGAVNLEVDGALEAGIQDEGRGE